MATHASTLAWKIPWMAKPGRLHPWGCKESDSTERLHFLLKIINCFPSLTINLGKAAEAAVVLSHPSPTRATRGSEETMWLINSGWGSSPL